MSKLTPDKIERLSRQMVDQFKRVQQEPTIGGYYEAAAKIANIMGGYPAEVVYMYFMLSLDQLIKGEPVVQQATVAERAAGEMEA